LREQRVLSAVLTPFAQTGWMVGEASGAFPTFPQSSGGIGPLVENWFDGGDGGFLG
jgi:hypothetical protein